MEDENSNNNHASSQGSSPMNLAFLPPPNPILNMKKPTIEECKIVFNCLEITKNETRKSQFQGEDFSAAGTQQLAAKVGILIFENFSESDGENVETISIASLFHNSPFEVYKKLDNSNVNTLFPDNIRCFAGFFFEWKALCQLIPLKQTQQNKLLSLEYFLALSSQLHKNYSRITTSSATQNENQSQKLTGLPSLPLQTFLKFDSSFESGNLFAAYQTSLNQYQLILSNDTNSNGSTQWFYFSVENTVKNVTVTFNIINLTKDKSLFGRGMRPVVLSMKSSNEEESSWCRAGFNISYKRNRLKREKGTQGTYYTLSFSYTFQHSGDKVFFAHCYPYTFTNLNKFISSLESSSPSKISRILQRQTLCYTLGKLPCEVLTITSNSQTINQLNISLSKKLSKDIIFILARQHPGESPGSWMVEGVIKQLCRLNCGEAQQLRDNYIFKVIPMINPDGVVIGNYRSDLTGVDLNRNWLRPQKDQLPQIYAIKKLIFSLSSTHKIRYIIDLHGHSKKMNAFFYCNLQGQDRIGPRILPLTCCEESGFMDFSSCTFQHSVDKATTARVTLMNMLSDQATEVLTLEASFCGYDNKNTFEKGEFTIENYRELGETIVRSLSKVLLHQDQERVVDIFTEETHELHQAKETSSHLKTEFLNHITKAKESSQIPLSILRESRAVTQLKAYEKFFSKFKLNATELLRSSLQKEDIEKEAIHFQTKSFASDCSDSDDPHDQFTILETESIMDLTEQEYDQQTNSEEYPLSSNTKVDSSTQTLDLCGFCSDQMKFSQTIDQPTAKLQDSQRLLSAVIGQRRRCTSLQQNFEQPQFNQRTLKPAGLDDRSNSIEKKPTKYNQLHIQLLQQQQQQQKQQPSNLNISNSLLHQYILRMQDSSGFIIETKRSSSPGCDKVVQSNQSRPSFLRIKNYPLIQQRKTSTNIFQNNTTQLSSVKGTSSIASINAETVVESLNLSQHQGERKHNHQRKRNSYFPSEQSISVTIIEKKLIDVFIQTTISLFQKTPSTQIASFSPCNCPCNILLVQSNESITPKRFNSRINSVKQESITTINTDIQENYQQKAEVLREAFPSPVKRWNLNRDRVCKNMRDYSNNQDKDNSLLDPCERQVLKEKQTIPLSQKKKDSAFKSMIMDGIFHTKNKIIVKSREREYSLSQLSGKTQIQRNSLQQSQYLDRQQLNQSTVAVKIINSSRKILIPIGQINQPQLYPNGCQAVSQLSKYRRAISVKYTDEMKQETEDELINVRREQDILKNPNTVFLEGYINNDIMSQPSKARGGYSHIKEHLNLKADRNDSSLDFVFNDSKLLRSKLQVKLSDKRQTGSSYQPTRNKSQSIGLNAIKLNKQAQIP